MAKFATCFAEVSSRGEGLKRQDDKNLTCGVLGAAQAAGLHAFQRVDGVGGELGIAPGELCRPGIDPDDLDRRLVTVDRSFSSDVRDGIEIVQDLLFCLTRQRRPRLGQATKIVVLGRVRVATAVATAGDLG